MRQRYGLAPVTQSRSELAFKSANTPADAISAGGLEAERGLAAVPLSVPQGAGGTKDVAGRQVEAGKLVEYTQQNRFAGGRSFYQNGNQWIDSTIQKLKDPKRVRVQLNSREYFDLVAKNSEALPWLALGQNVQFVLGDTVYEIYE